MVDARSRAVRRAKRAEEAAVVMAPVFAAARTPPIAIDPRGRLLTEKRRATGESPSVHNRAPFALSSPQLVCAFLGVLLVDTGYKASLGQPAAHPILALVSLLAYLGGFAALILAAARPRARLDDIAAIGLLATFLLQMTVGIVTQPALGQYGTDALAFNHYSAQLVLAGRDPYTASMEPAYREFDVPASVYTPTVNGGLVLSQSYPALSFLVYVPFVAMHLRSMLFVELGFGVLSMLLLYMVAAPGRKALVLLIFFASSEYLNFAQGSVTDVIWLPLLMLAAAFWDSDSLVVPIALGLACAVKQDPWFVVPFALVHWAMRRNAGYAVRQGAITAAAFLVPNLPFVIWDPAAWLRGIFFPMISGAIPAGSGVVELMTSNVFPFPVSWLSWEWPLVLLAGVALYVLRYRAVAWLPFIWPAVALFFSPRSLENYFLYWPIVVVTYLAVGRPQAAAAPSRPFASKRFAVALAAATFCILGLATAVSLAAFKQLRAIQIVGTTIDPSTNLVRAVDVAVAGTTPEARRYRFAVDSPSTGAVFWNLARAIPGSGDDALVRLDAPSVSEEVPVSRHEGIQVAAYDARRRLAAYSSSWMPSTPAVASLSDMHMICALSRFSAPIAVPLTWVYSDEDFLDGAARCAPHGSSDGVVTFRVLRPSGNAWNVAQLSELVRLGSGTFAFWERPGSDASLTALPTHLFGVSLVDGLNHQFYVLTSSHVRKPVLIAHDRFRYYIVPGRPNVWNRIVVDTRRIPGFYVAPYGMVQLIVIEALHAGSSSRSVVDEFGGFGPCVGACGEAPT